MPHTICQGQRGKQAGRTASGEDSDRRHLCGIAHGYLRNRSRLPLDAALLPAAGFVILAGVFSAPRFRGVFQNFPAFVVPPASGRIIDLRAAAVRQTEHQQPDWRRKPHESESLHNAMICNRIGYANKQNQERKSRISRIPRRILWNHHDNRRKVRPCVFVEQLNRRQP